LLTTGKARGFLKSILSISDVRQLQENSMSANALETSPVQDLVGRVAVITGASSGMGRASALLLARRGAKVALLARRKAQLDEVAADIRRAGGSAIAIVTDVTDQVSVEAAAAAVKHEYGDADLVFNNAGLMLPGAIGQQPQREWEAQISLNVTGAMRVIQAFVPQLEAAAARGKVVDLINTSSIAGQYVFGYFAVYAATKAFVSHLTRHLRVELGPRNIRVSVIEPAYTRTQFDANFLAPDAKLDEYRDVRALLDKVLSRVMASADEPTVVAKVVLHAALAARPKVRYTAGGLAHRLRWLRRFAPARLVDAGIRKDLRLDAAIGPTPALAVSPEKQP